MQLTNEQKKLIFEYAALAASLLKLGSNGSAAAKRERMKEIEQELGMPGDEIIAQARTLAC